MFYSIAGMVAEPVLQLVLLSSPLMLKYLQTADIVYYLNYTWGQ